MDKMQRVEQLSAKILEMQKELAAIQKEIWVEKFNNKDYLTDLSEYKGKRLDSIRAFGPDGKEIYLPTDEDVIVESNGRLKASSYASGVLEYDEEAGCYVNFFSGQVKVLDIVGFTDIEVAE